MGGWRRVVAMGILCVMAGAGLPGAASADSEVDILLSKLVEKGVLSASDAQEIRNELGPQRVQDEKVMKEQLAKAGPAWVKNTDWKGDFRIRNEYRDRSGTGNTTNRQRLRFRYGFTTKPSDALTIGARLATGGLTDPTSTNQSFDGSFVKKGFNLDRAYIDYHPTVPGLTASSLIAGVMENPFQPVSPLVWDDDLSFDGAALKLAGDLGPLGLFGNLGVFSLDSDDETETAALWSAQGGASLKPFQMTGIRLLDDLKVTGAVAYHDYANVTTSAKAGTDLVSRLASNNANLAVLKDLNELNPSLTISTTLLGLPLNLAGDLVHNFGATDESDGYYVGVKLGKAKTPWSLTEGWEAAYFFERLESNAVFDEFTDSDFGGGGTNHRGNVWSLALAVLPNSTVGVKWFETREVLGAKNHYNTVQMDWVTKF